MINATEAANTAIEYLKSFYKGAKNIMLEEVEISEEKKSWSVMISFENTFDEKNPPNIIQRINKVFRVDNSTGQVTSMKNRDFK